MYVPLLSPIYEKSILYRPYSGSFCEPSCLFCLFNRTGIKNNPGVVYSCPRRTPGGIRFFFFFRRIWSSIALFPIAVTYHFPPLPVAIILISIFDIAHLSFFYYVTRCCMYVSNCCLRFYFSFSLSISCSVPFSRLFFLATPFPFPLPLPSPDPGPVYA